MGSLEGGKISIAIDSDHERIVRTALGRRDRCGGECYFTGLSADRVRGGEENGKQGKYRASPVNHQNTSSRVLGGKRNDFILLLQVREDVEVPVEQRLNAKRAMG